MSSLLIKNARYLGDSVDLLVVDGKVQSLSASINAPTDAEIVDAAGKILFPSFIDVHTHLREPGYEWKETVATGLSSASIPSGRPPSASRERNSPACPNSRMPDASPSPTTDAQ